jgi:biotin transport system substrate-specific component
MQTFGVFLAVGLLGGRNGTLAVLVYILLGAAGLPVFSGFSGGIGHLFGATGGYIIGFVFSALLMWLAEALFGKSNKVLIASMVAGLLVCYAFGTVWFMVVYARDSGSIGLITALSWCVFPYIIPDALKILLAAVLTRRLRPLIKG